MKRKICLKIGKEAINNNLRQPRCSQMGSLQDKTKTKAALRISIQNFQNQEKFFLQFSLKEPQQQLLREFHLLEYPLSNKIIWIFSKLKGWVTIPNQLKEKSSLSNNKKEKIKLKNLKISWKYWDRRNNKEIKDFHRLSKIFSDNLNIEISFLKEILL